MNGMDAMKSHGAAIFAIVFVLMAVTAVHGQIRKSPAKGPIELPAGARMRVSLNTSLDSRRTRSGERFTAILVKPVYWGRHTVIPKGSMVHGIAAEVKQPVMRITDASITIVFDRIEIPDGRSVPIAAGIPGDFSFDEAMSKGGAFAGKHVAKEVLNQAVGGMLTPLYIADYARRGVQFIQKDKDVIIPKGTILEIYLQQPAKVPI